MKLTLLISQKPSARTGSSLYLKKEWMGMDPAFPERCVRLSLATRWQSLWKQMSLGVRNSKQRALQPYFLASPRKQARSSFLGLVLSMTTLPPRFISSSAALQHFSFVFSVSRFTRRYFGMQLCQKVDLPDAGLPTKITISFSTNYTVLPLPTTTSPLSGIVVGLNPFTSIVSFSPKNKFSGVLNSIPTLRANLRSESEKSLCLPSLRPAASPQKKDLALMILTPPLLLSRVSHILVPGLRYSSSWAAMKTCISTPMALAMFSTLVRMSDALVWPFCMPAWLVKMTILQPSSQSSFTLGLTLSLRNSQSCASLGNLAPLLRVMMVSSMSKDATFSSPMMPADDPTRHVFSSVQLHPPTFLLSFAILPCLNCCQICIKPLLSWHMRAHSNKIKGRAGRKRALRRRRPWSSIESNVKSR